MRAREPGIFSLIGIGILYSFAPGWGENQSGETVLTNLLARAASYCQRLEAASLDFVCRETIVERIYYVMPEKAHLQPGPTQSYIQRVDRLNSFEYDYQLKRFGEGRTEMRTLLRENGRKKNEPRAELKTQTFQSRFVIFGPTGLIGEAAQQRYVYRHIRDEEIGGERCAVLETTPRSDMPRDRLDGKIWISPKDGGIRRIQWRPESIGNYELLRRTGELLGAAPRLTFVSEYGHGYRGLRFPSLVTVKEEYLQPRYRPLLFSETEVRYAAYRFFTVETKTELIEPDGIRK